MEKVFNFAADSKYLSSFRGELRTILKDAGWDEKAINEIALALDETLTNIIRHAYSKAGGNIKIRILDSPEKTEFWIEDSGKKFDPTAVPAPDLPKTKPGGLGVHFVRTIMDDFIYDYSFAEGNRLHLIKKK